MFLCSLSVANSFLPFDTVTEYANEIPFTKPAPIDEMEAKKQKKGGDKK